MKWLTILFCGLLLSACALPITPSVCDRPEAVDSRICAICAEVGVQVEDVDWLLQVASNRVLDEHDKSKVLVVLDDIVYFLGKPTITYADLVAYIKFDIQLTGPEILFISRYLPMLDSSYVISGFDKYLLLKHIEHQRAMLK